MSLKPREIEMLALRDEGLNASQIARRMGIKADSVKRTLTLLDDTPGHDLRREAEIRAATRELGRAIKAAR